MRAVLALARFRVMRALAPVNRLLPSPMRRALLPQASMPVADVPRPAAGATPRLLIAPTNTAGQGWLWARAVMRELPASFAASMAFRAPGGFAFPVDQEVPLARYRWSPEWARAQRAEVSASYTHLLLESGREPFGDASGRSVTRQVSDLTRAGIRVALVFHGSDIRHPSAHREREPGSPFHDRGWTMGRLHELRSRENRALTEQLGIPVFVTTPDLLHDLPQARWLPVVVDPAPWQRADDHPPFAQDRVPVVVHAPSVGTVKGSHLIDPVLRSLEREGLVEYRRATGIPSAQMPGLYGDADLVVDQLLLGAYGVAAIEAMNAGRIVLGHVAEDVRAAVHELTGLDVPVVEAVADSLESVLRSVLADPAAYAATVDAGRRFAADVHGGRYSVEVLRDFLGA